MSVGRLASGAAFVLLAACKTQAPAADAAPLPSASVPVVEAPSAAPSMLPMPTALPAPAASVACSRDIECVAVESPCCNAWPSNVANKEQVRRAMLANDGERCKTRLCALKLHDAACINGTCVVH
jgi:hypothetical protein